MVQLTRRRAAEERLKSGPLSLPDHADLACERQPARSTLGLDALLTRQ